MCSKLPRANAATLTPVLLAQLRIATCGWSRTRSDAVTRHTTLKHSALLCSCLAHTCHTMPFLFFRPRHPPYATVLLFPGWPFAPSFAVLPPASSFFAHRSAWTMDHELFIFNRNSSQYLSSHFTRPRRSSCVFDTSALDPAPSDGRARYELFRSFDPGLRPGASLASHRHADGRGGTNQTIHPGATRPGGTGPVGRSPMVQSGNSVVVAPFSTLTL